MSGSHHQITDIHEGQSFEEKDFNEHFSFLLSEDVESWTKKALQALKSNAKAIIPAAKMKDVVFSSIDNLGRRIVSWRYGSPDWVNETSLGEGWNRKVYTP